MIWPSPLVSKKLFVNESGRAIGNALDAFGKRAPLNRSLVSDQHPKQVHPSGLRAKSRFSADGTSGEAHCQHKKSDWPWEARHAAVTFVVLNLKMVGLLNSTGQHDLTTSFPIACMQLKRDNACRRLELFAHGAKTFYPRSKPLFTERRLSAFRADVRLDAPMDRVCNE